MKKKDSQQQVAIVKENIKNQFDHQHKAIVYFPVNTKDDHIKTDLNAMLATQELNIPCVNAYTGAYPQEYLLFFNTMNYVDLQSWMSYNHLGSADIQVINDFGIKEDKREVVYLKAANGKFVSADEGTTFVNANAAVASTWETFSIITCGKSSVIIGDFNHFLTADLGHQNELVVNRVKVGDWEKFIIAPLDRNFIAIKAANGKYLSLDEKSLRLSATADSAGINERFEVVKN